MTQQPGTNSASGSDSASGSTPPESPEVYAESQPASAQPQSGGSVGSGNYEVQQGDCIESIAYNHGFFWETLWNHSNNQQLRSVRKDRNVLLAGDKVFIPELRSKQESVAAEQRHRFKRKGVPSKLRLILMYEDNPRAHTEYVLDIDGKLLSGKTDAQGALEHPIPPNAKRGKLFAGTQGEVYELILGNIDPVSEMTGVQSRLQNLGFYCEVTGELDMETREAIRAFQEKHGLPDTSEPDDPMRQRLQQGHGS